MLPQHLDVSDNTHALSNSSCESGIWTHISSVFQLRVSHQAAIKASTKAAVISRHNGVESASRQLLAKFSCLWTGRLRISVLCPSQHGSWLHQSQPEREEGAKERTRQSPSVQPYLRNDLPLLLYSIHQKQVTRGGPQRSIGNYTSV